MNEKEKRIATRLEVPFAGIMTFEATGEGLKVIEVIEVNEGSVSVRVPPQRFEASLARVEAAPAPVSPGQLTVSASVTIRYRIGQ